MHERLIDSDLRLGRQILTDYVTSVEAAGTLRRDRPNDYQVAGRTLAMLDILGLYAERKYVDSQLVFQEWGPSYAALCESGRYYITERVAREKPGHWAGWPHFQRLSKKAMQSALENHDDVQSQT
jgi:hypothetical protein